MGTRRLYIAGHETRIPLGRIDSPEEDYVGAIPQLSERGAGPPAPLGSEETFGGAGGGFAVHGCTELIGQSHGQALRLGCKVCADEDQ
jgi:hypothetical protein